MYHIEIISLLYIFLSLNKKKKIKIYTKLKKNKVRLQVETESDWTVIAAGDTIANHVVRERVGELLGQDEVVETPADVGGARVSQIAPVRVADSIGIQATKRVEIALGQEARETSALFHGEAGAFLIRVRVANVDAFVRNVHVAAPNDRLLFLQTGEEFRKRLFPLETIRQTYEAATCVRNIFLNI